MKILMINVVCGIRSTGRMCTDLATALETNGHEVKIAYGREIVPEEFSKYAVRIGNDTDVKLHGVKARIFDKAGFGSTKATVRFIEWVKQYDPDVIHLHNIHGYYINVEILFNYLKTCGKKVIWTLHDCWAFTGHTAYCDAIGCERWQDGCYKCPQLGEYPKSFFDNSKNNWIRKKEVFTGVLGLTIVTPSAWLEGLVKRSFLKDYKTVVVHNGIDVKLFNNKKGNFREKLGIKNKIILLGIATSWDNNKGLDDYEKLAELLDEEVYQIVLVGVTEQQKIMLSKNIIGICRTNSIEELVQIYSASDFLLNLSKTENYPTVNLEAICCGTPVITYDVGGSSESVAPDFGIVVPKGDVDAVANAVKKSLIIPNFDKEKFDKMEVVKEYLDIIQS